MTTNDSNAPVTMTRAELDAILARLSAQDAQIAALRPRTKEEIDARNRELNSPAADGGPRSNAHVVLAGSLVKLQTITVRRIQRSGPGDDGLAVINAADFDATQHERVEGVPAPVLVAPSVKADAAIQTRDEMLSMTHAALADTAEAKALASMPKTKTELVDAILAARG